MSMQAMLAPVFVQVALVFFLIIRLGRSRVAALQAGTVKMADVARSGANWPEQIRITSDSYNSQFQIPVLFYLVTLVAIATGKADTAGLMLGWLFVATRLVHAFIHNTSNRVRHRFYAFTTGVITLAVMWVYLAVQLFFNAG